MKVYWSGLSPSTERAITLEWAGHFLVSLVLPRILFYRIKREITYEIDLN